MDQIALSEDGNDVTFNIESTGGAQKPSFKFGIRLSVFSKAMKFNVTIDNMDSEWRAEANYYALCYRVEDQSSSKTDAPAEKQAKTSDTRIAINDDAFFSIVPTAVDMTSGETRKVFLNFQDDSGKSVCTFYERFNKTMFHDPEFGYVTQDSHLWIVVLISAIGGAMVVAALVIGIAGSIICCRRRTMYENL